VTLNSKPALRVGDSHSPVDTANQHHKIQAPDTVKSSTVLTPIQLEPLSQQVATINKD
jgi:hypothetical protein